jgi:hypothetical protein
MSKKEPPIPGSMEWFKSFDHRLNPRRFVPGKSKFDHFFGGHIKDIAPDLARLPLHVLYSLDLRDPLLDFLKLKGPRLSLIFPLTVDGGDVSYLCTPQGGIKLLGKKPGPRAADWPRPNYPDALPKIALQVRELEYEEYRAAVFAYQIGPAEWLREDDQAILNRIGRHFTQLGGVLELAFGEPFDMTCPNPKCTRHKDGGMQMLTAVWNQPLPGITLWEEGDDVQIAYTMCRECSAISACTMVD